MNKVTESEDLGRVGGAFLKAVGAHANSRLSVVQVAVDYISNLPGKV